MNWHEAGWAIIGGTPMGVSGVVLFNPFESIGKFCLYFGMVLIGVYLGLDKYSKQQQKKNDKLDNSPH